ncbi:von Willebrand domain-containing protein [Purpureocillium lavendulum]|uniref:von Willebrand domain-containing protein n=1 Tax=Purpureocillium lavendulum TaxID=1247861 RepID=A0AB34FUP6_9HYPO|nr:von Willebrand domain-containing protein [Purpureocillium lavendulum]
MTRTDYYRRLPLCGCFVIVQSQRKWLPLINLDAHATILSSTSRTVLKQTFTNPDAKSALDEVHYDFPLYDGVSVVGFRCTVGDRVITGVVKERQAAKKTYDDAVSKGDTAALLQQNLRAADVFTTTIGNVPAGAKVTVEITYLGELEHDAETDGVRLTIPASIAPRYDSGRTVGSFDNVKAGGGKISVTVDAEMAEGCSITSVQSPTHPISVRIGHTSASSAGATSEPASLRRASATLSLGSVHLEKDIVVQVVADGLGNPTALLEVHPTLPGRRAIMTTLVPRFNLTAGKPEVVFVCDRSGSMGVGQKMPNLVAALQLFLKSLPVGARFNVCSFGSRCTFLWDKSRLYDSQETLDAAVDHVKGFSSNYGGTEMYTPLDETFKRRYKDMDLEVFLLTDGEIWEHERLFNLVNDNVRESKGAIRIFTLGVGEEASSALINGVARAGNGFAQRVAEDEKMDKKIIRMLKGALTPHITDYALEVKYGDDGDEDFEVVEKVMDALSLDVGATASKAAASQEPIPLFDTGTKDEDMEMPDSTASIDAKFDGLPAVPRPRYLQAPFEIPALFPFNRTTVYVMLSDETTQRGEPTSIVLTGTSAQGPLRLEIPVTRLAEKGSTIHQLAARKAVQELEEGRGWITHAKDVKGNLLKKEYEGQFERMVQREAVALGVEFQVGGKWCSFVAVREAEGGEKGQETGKEEVGEFEVVHPPEPMKPMMMFGGAAAPRSRMMSAPRMMAARAEPASAFSASPPPPAPSGGVFGSAAPGGFGSLMSTGPGNAVNLKKKKRAVGRASVAEDSETRGFSPQMASLQHSDAEDAEPVMAEVALSTRRSAEPSASRGSGQRGSLGSLAALQTFVGSWSWSAELERVLGLTQQQAAGKVSGLEGDVLATLCAVAYLKKKLANERDAWELMVEKAESWLENQTGEGKDVLARKVDAAALFA